MMKNKSIDDILEERLEEWAEWIRGGNFIGIGYPRQSTLELIRTGQIFDHNHAYQPQIQVNENAEEMEKYICEMAEYKLIMAQSLRMFYLDRLSFRSSSKKLKISISHYHTYVQMAKQWLIGRITKYN